MRVVVTGAAGRLGSVVARHLANFHEVVATDIRGGAGIQAVNVCDYATLLAACRQAQAVVHLAGLDYDTPSDLRRRLEVNVVGTATVLEVCRELDMCKTVICSSVAALGLHERRQDWIPQEIPVTERHGARPMEAYSISKKMVEIVTRAVASDLESVLCVRPVAVAFPGQLQQFASDMLSDRHSLRDFIAAEDVATAIQCYLAIDHQGYDCVTLAADESVTDQPMLDWFKQQFPTFNGFIDAGYFNHRPFASMYSNQVAKQLLSWQPQWHRDALWPELRESSSIRGVI
jgi:nucleoside-diphosphate-sugar epimerase